MNLEDMQKLSLHTSGADHKILMTVLVACGTVKTFAAPKSLI